MNKFIFCTLVSLLGLGFQAEAATPLTYELTIINASPMPLSPTAFYVRNGNAAAVEVGQIATPGFIQLCQTGNPALRVTELSGDKSVSSISQSSGLLMPGESKTVEITVVDPLQQSIHFEAMYGKSKDVCAVGSIDNLSLLNLAQHRTPEVIAHDEALQTGAFTLPALVNGDLNNSCSAAADAISCVRELSSMAATPVPVRFFAGYSSSLLSALEMKYGASDVAGIQLPTGGAVRLKLVLKH